MFFIKGEKAVRTTLSLDRNFSGEIVLAADNGTIAEDIFTFRSDGLVVAPVTGSTVSLNVEALGFKTRSGCLVVRNSIREIGSYMHNSAEKEDAAEKYTQIMQKLIAYKEAIEYGQNRTDNITRASVIETLQSFIDKS